ncbi:MAG: hypothetical protein ACREXU_07375 [Gammaproteobacteria bacterium]
MKQRHTTSDAGTSIGASETAQSMRPEATISDARTNAPREETSPTQALTAGGNGKDGTLVAGIVATAAPKVLHVVAQTEMASIDDCVNEMLNGVSVVSRGLGEGIRIIGGAD